MPIRMYGFLRLGHVGSWGTRTDAYTANQTESDPTSVSVMSATGGDPRALLPYLFASALVALGVLYDAQLF
jgi:hyaluronan synthase